MEMMMALPGDFQLTFCITRPEVIPIRNESELDRLLDEYISVLRRELKKKIVEDFPKLSRKR